MSGLLCSAVFMSGCGKAADVETETVSEDDDEEDEADDEDEEAEPEEGTEPDKQQEPVIVKTIDEDTLAAQTDVFLDGRDDWVIPAEEAYQCDSTFYAMTDMNHNGRTELIVGDWAGAANVSTVSVYEINETGDGFRKLDWSFTGCDSDKKSCPEVSISGFVDGYFDDETGISHYLFQDFFLYSFTDGGIRFCDLSIVGDTVVSYAYAMGLSQGSDGKEVDTYYGPNGEMTESDYIYYRSSYPRGYTLKTINFGFYYGEDVFSREAPSVQYMERDDLGSILKDSYRVFDGRLDYDTFYDRYLVEDEAMTSEELLEASVGSWGLVMSDTEGDITYYSPDDDRYKTLDVYENMSIHLVEEAGTEVEYAFDMNIFEHGDGSLMGSYTPDQKDGRFYDELVISITGRDEEGRLTVDRSAWSGRSCIGGSTWYFERID